MKRSLVALILCALPGAWGCVGASKSSNPLSPTVSGPIPGVGISAPEPMAPNEGARIPVDQQPVTLTVQNATTTGVRPLFYRIDIATDTGFTNKVFSRDNIAPGADGRTSLRLPDALTPERSYYWRAQALDGANEGPISRFQNFTVFTPIVIGRPVAISPAGNVTIAGNRPTFVIGNAPRTGPAGAITYTIEISQSESFSDPMRWTVGESAGQTSFAQPQDLAAGKQFFWHVRASDPTTTGSFSDTAVFKTPAAPPAGGGGGGGGSGSGGGSGDIKCATLNESCAQDIVNGTAAEYPALTAVFGSDQAATDAATQLLLRIIWHLNKAGFTAGRQRNPSGIISGDKLTIFIGGSVHAYDVFSLGFAGRATTVQFLEVFPPSYIAEGGLPD